VISPHRFLLVPVFAVACVAWSVSARADDFLGGARLGYMADPGAPLLGGELLVAKDDSELSLALGLRF
jgi:hypothetical protein